MQPWCHITPSNNIDNLLQAIWVLIFLVWLHLQLTSFYKPLQSQHTHQLSKHSPTLWSLGTVFNVLFLGSLCHLTFGWPRGKHGGVNWLRWFLKWDGINTNVQVWKPIEWKRLPSSLHWTAELHTKRLWAERITPFCRMKWLGMHATYWMGWWSPLIGYWVYKQMLLTEKYSCSRAFSAVILLLGSYVRNLKNGKIQIILLQYNQSKTYTSASKHASSLNIFKHVQSYDPDWPV